MDPIFTLQWPEFCLAEKLQKEFPKRDGYSVLVPASRQEKGIDLAVLKKAPGGLSRVITLQIKASRTYTHQPKSSGIRRYRYRTWYRRFPVPEEADFILLFGIFAPDLGLTVLKGRESYRDCTLVFTKDEMKTFMSGCLTVSGKPDGMFGFGFDDPDAVHQTRPATSVISLRDGQRKARKARGHWLK